MAKDPASLFYPGDWLGGTMGMTFEEKGAYVELLMLQFNRGHMTKDMIGQTIGQLWDNLKDKFVVDDKGLYYNVRLEEEKKSRQKYTESRRNNILGVNQHTKTQPQDRGHMTDHMENENEDVNEDKDSIKKESFGNFIKLFNEITKRKFSGDSKAKRQFNARIKEGYNLDYFETAIKHCLSDDFHQENPHYLTPEFITRADKLEKYINYQPKNDKKSRYHTGDQDYSKKF